MSAYTDDDVTAVAKALAHTDLVGMPYSAVAAHVLSQVAPAITERELLQAADDAAHDLFDNNDPNVFEAWLRARAEQVTDA